MTITPTQMTAISSQLAVDLSSQSTDRLIELCLLHRAAPDALPSFVVALETEIQRRFTSAEIASNDVMFSVLQNFLNQFASPVPYFQLQMIQMAASVNRDIWFQNNADLFATSIDDVDVMTWLLTEPDILNKCLNNSFGLTMLAQSTTASTAILTHDPAVTLWKQATNLWTIWQNHTAGMTVLAKSSELMSYVAASSTAMTAVAASSVALAAIVKSNLARTALMNSNDILQSYRQAIFNTVAANWAMVRRTAYSAATFNSANAAYAGPQGFVFAYLGKYDDRASAITMFHANSVRAAIGHTRVLGNETFVLAPPLDCVSFNGMFLEPTSGTISRASLELWTPPT